jgi:hypothetical protein
LTSKAKDEEQAAGKDKAAAKEVNVFGTSLRRAAIRMHACVHNAAIRRNMCAERPVTSGNALRAAPP